MRRWLFDAVAVTGPNRDAPLGLEAGEQPGRVPHRDVGPAVLALGGRRHLAAGQVGHELHAVANREERRPELEQLRTGLRRARINNRVGATGQNDALWGELFNETEVGAARGGMDLAVDVRLAHPARDELGEL